MFPWPVSESVLMSLGKEGPGQLIRHIRPCPGLEYLIEAGDSKAVNKFFVDKD